jgi:hypothetical protein
MRPLSEFPPQDLTRLSCVLCDIDDTLTLDGRLPAVAYGALERLHDAGLTVVPITGRPAGWCDHIARMWPVDGIVGENGAVAFRYDPAAHRMIRLYARTPDQRIEDLGRLDDLARKILSEVPGSAVSSDQAYRETDLAIDFREDVDPLSDDDVSRIKQMFEAAGATAKISSIHVNGWFGDHDKLSMTRQFIRAHLDLDIDAIADQIAFVGDSPNDAPMFAHFPNAIGVANVADFADRLAARPKWITGQRGGYGFAEFADLLLAAREQA